MTVFVRLPEKLLVKADVGIKGLSPSFPNMFVEAAALLPNRLVYDGGIDD